MSNALDATLAKVKALVAPRNVVIVGASDRPGSWGGAIAQKVRRHGYEHPLYYVNPHRAELWGERCYRDVTALPEPPDHLAILVPAAAVVDVIAQGAAAGARSATVYSTGFGEGGSAAETRRRQHLLGVVEQTGIALCGPNCLGNIFGKSRLVTMLTEPARVGDGPVALVGQSGGVVLYLNEVLTERGIHCGYVISSGNEIGLSTSDYLNYFASDDEIRIVFCYLEGISDFPKFREACLRARRANKYVVVLKAGQTDAGRAAALAHTGSLAGDYQAFDAAISELGVIRMDSLDEIVETIELLLRTGEPRGSRLGALTLSGAFCSFLADAAARNNLSFPPLSGATGKAMAAFTMNGAAPLNPVDGGSLNVLSSIDTFMTCVKALDKDPNIDMVLIQDETPRRSGAMPHERYLGSVADFARTAATKPIAFVSMLSHGQSDYSRRLRDATSNLAFLNEPGKALKAIGRAAHAFDMEKLTYAHEDVGDDASLPDIDFLNAETSAKDIMALDEPRSKALLGQFGIRTPRESHVHSESEAVDAANRIGYPVVLKIVSNAILHKSEYGGVALNLGDNAAVRRAFASLKESIRARGIEGRTQGVLVSEQVTGVELALGVHRDPSVGLVLMVGSGGLMVELLNDVAFAAIPVGKEKARRLLGSTRVWKLLSGFRGRPPAAIDSVIDAIVALSRMAVALGPRLESIDLNPIIAGPERAAVAVDALVILRPAAAAKESDKVT